MSDKEKPHKSEERRLRDKEWQREYRRKRKSVFKEQGICPNCEKRTAADGRVCCSQCLEDKKLTLLFGTAGPYRQIYAELYEKQRGQCGICGENMKRPLLDHNHETMEVRGLLCSNCNVGLGQFRDNPELLMKAHRYVTENGGIGIKMKRRK